MVPTLQFCRHSETGSASRQPCLRRENFLMLPFPLLSMAEAGKVSFAPWNTQSRPRSGITLMLSTQQLRRSARSVLQTVFREGLLQLYISETHWGSDFQFTCEIRARGKPNLCTRALIMRERYDPEMRPTAIRHPQHTCLPVIE